ncbi:hypothetical protein XELAEV_18001759mg [Xenopus laevis]|uniref:Uncharacterized protein n=1 Tax=Xenopus laevis TaxID=8355 RepID=A0A974BP96_XENLA|nr:hypothetical protein XELAEV_18001759mg [Xenopus laevis]
MGEGRVQVGGGINGGEKGAGRKGYREGRVIGGKGIDGAGNSAGRIEGEGCREERAYTGEGRTDSDPWC